MANNRIVVQQGQTAGAILGTYDIFGTNAGAETVTVFDGTTANFQGDFGRGGDIIRIADVAGDFTVALSGSNIVLTSASDGITVRIPVGTVGAKVVFENAAGQLTDERTLIFNGSSVILGNQVVTAVATAVNGGDQGNNPTTTVLTAGQDVLTGSSSADTYVAQNTNLNAGDIIDGGAGSDRLRVFADRSLSQASYAGFEVSNVETLEFTNDSAGLGSFDLSSSSGFETLVNRNSTQAVAFNQLTALANLVIANLTNSATSATTVQFQDLVVAGSADAVTVALNSTDASTIRIGSVAEDDAGIETLNLEVSGRATKIQQIDSDISTLNLSGAQNLTIAQTLNSTIKSVVGASYTGNVSLSVDGAAAGVTIDLGSGNDTVTGSSKADTINVRGGNNSVVAGDGNDTVTAADGANVINAGAGDDQVTVGNGANTIVTGDGVNRVTGGNGANTVTGGTGADTIDLGNGANSVVAGDGANRVTVGGGVNTVTTGDGADLVTAGNGGNTITTNAGNDTINAGDGNDSLVAGAGNDSVSAGGGNDTILAGDGNDFVSAGAGNDQVFIGTGIDTVLAGAGSDTIDATANFDADGTPEPVLDEDGDPVLDDDGNPVLIFVPDRDSIDGGADRDTLVVTAGATDANFRFVSSVEVLSVTTAGTTTLSALAQAAGIDQVDARNAGNDIVDAATFTRGLTVNLTGGDDKVTTGSGNDTINIASFTNGDTLNAGAGQDTLNLDADTAINSAAFAGFELLNLGSGRDEVTDGHVYSFVLGAGNAPNPNTGVQGQVLAIDGSALAADNDVAGPLVAETLTVDASAVNSYRLDIKGGAAADTITSGALNDTISTGAGADTIVLTGGNNLVDAGSGNDSVTLGTGKDSVSGGVGDDSFTVASASLSADDTVSGGEGANALSISGSSVDAQYTNVTEVQTLNVVSAASVTKLAAEAEQAGIRTVTLANGGNTLDAANYSADANLTVTGGTGNDSISTGAGADSVRSGLGNDTVATGAGADFIAAGAGNDVVSTGMGDDVVELGTGNDSISLGSGNDVVRVSAADDLTFDDSIQGGEGDDEILLVNTAAITAGVNLSNVGGVETVRVDRDGAGVDVTFTGGNVSTLTTVTVDATAMLSGNSGTATVTLDGGQADSDYSFVVLGGGARDVLVKLNSGVNNNIVFNAGGGNDEARFFSGQDLGSTTFLSGGAGTDSIVLLGGFVNDDSFVSVSSFERLSASGTQLAAQLGERALASGLQTIDADAGAFNDNILLDARFTGPLAITLGSGDDVVNAGATTAILTFSVSAGQITSADTLIGGKSADDVVRLSADNKVANFSTSSGIERFVVVESGDSNVGLVLTDASFAGVASNTIVVDASALDDVSPDLVEGGLLLDAAAVSGKLNVTGGTGNDEILTGSAADTIVAGAGNDTIRAGAGNNSVDAGSGDDLIETGAGNDTINAGAGNDVIRAGEGNNVVNLGAGNDFVETGSGVDIITNDGGNNTVRSGAGADQVTLGDGNNDVDTGAGTDTVVVGGGNNVVRVGQGNDTVTAGEGNNLIIAGDGNDSITVGDKGSSTITGGQGADRITLGDGANTVRFLQASDSFGLAATRDTVVGFDSNDTITIETNVLALGVKSLNYVGDALDSQEAQLGINARAGDGKADAVYDTSTGRLLIDINDDGILDARDLAISFETEAGARAPGGFLSQAQFKVIDSVAPAALSLDLQVASDSGNENNDNLTNISPVTVRVFFDNSSVDGSAALVGDKLTLTNPVNSASADRVLAAADVAAGFVDLAIALGNPDAAAAGTANTLQAVLQDAAGNTSAVTLAVQFDNAKPTISISDFDGSDAFINAAEDGSVVISGTAAKDTEGNILTVNVTDGTNSVVGTATVDGFGDWSTAGLDLSGLKNGGLTVTASVVDKAGNASVAATGTLSTTLDNVLPTVTITDDETNVANIVGTVVVYTFTFSEPVNDFAVGDIVIVNGTAGTFTKDSATVYRLEVLPTQGFEGDMTVSVPAARALDLAGNPNVASATSTQAVDTIAPTLEIGTPIMGDNRVNADEDSVVVVGGKFTNAEVGQVVTVSLSGNIDGADKTAVTTAKVNSDGTWATSTVDLAAAFGVSSELGDAVTVKAELSDAAGNKAAVVTEVISFDNNAPDTEFEFAGLEQEKNESEGSNEGDTDRDDLITNLNPADVTFFYDIKLTPGDVVQAFLGGKWVDLTATNSTIEDGAIGIDGKEVVTLKDVALAEGETTIDLRVVDAAGNIGPETPATIIVLDQTAPSVGTVSWVSVTEEVNVAPGSNQGDTVATDGITNQGVASVVFSYDGDDLDAAERFQYSVDGGSVWIDLDSASAVDTDDNTVTVSNIDVTLSPTVELRAIDVAGNETAVLSSKVITYDKDAPDVSDFSWVKVSEDSDDPSADKVTNVGTADLTFSYTGKDIGEGERFQYSVDNGSTWVDGNFTVDADKNSLVLNDLDVTGSPTVLLRAIDVAGNETGTLASQEIVYDDTAPTVTAVKYNNETDTFTVTGLGFDTNGKATIDVTKLGWDVDGNGSVDLTLTKDAVATVINDTQFTIQLTKAGAAALEGLTGFAGVVADKVSFDANAFIDNAGNNSALTSLNVTLNLEDNDSPNTLFGGPLNDTLDGALGNDTIVGRASNDVILGGEGNDTIWGGIGNDTVNAGAGDDTVIVVGTFNQATAQPAYNAALSALLGYTDVLGNGLTAEYVAGQEQITFGDGFDTMQVFGTVNLADLDLQDMPEAVVLNSTLILTSVQLAEITQIDLRGNLAHSIQISGVTNAEAVALFQAWAAQPGNKLLTSDGDSSIVLTIDGGGDQAPGTPFTGPTGLASLTTKPATVLLVGANETYTTIQAAVDAANAGDTIVVAAGTYAETVTVSKAVSILGANSGVAAHVAGVANLARGPETVVKAFHLTAGANLDGLKVLDGASVAGELAGVYVAAGGVTVQNMVFERTGDVDGDSSRGLVTTAGVEPNLTVAGSLFTGWATGIFANDYGDTGTSISGNAFVGNFVGMSLDDPDGVTLSGNLFINNVFEQIGVGVLDASEDVGAVVAASNIFTGTAPQVSIYAGGSNQKITGTVHNDLFNGSAGTDEVLYVGALEKSDFAIVDGKWVVTSKTEGTDTLVDIEIVEGSNGRYLLVGAGGFATAFDAGLVAEDGDIILNAGSFSFG